MKVAACKAFCRTMGLFTGSMDHVGSFSTFQDEVRCMTSEHYSACQAWVADMLAEQNTNTDITEVY